MFREKRFYLKFRHFFFLIIPIILLSFSGCGKQTCSCFTISPPDITLTGPKTSIEKQIMGDYKEIEKNAWLVASAKSGEGSGAVKKGNGSQMQREIKVFRSFAILEKSQEKLTDYQQKGIIGENNKGYVEKVSKELDKVESAKIDIQSLLNTVNQARKSLYISMQQDAKELNMTLDEISKIYSQKYQDLAPKECKIQMASGKWIVKK